ncbi:DNA repair protein rad18 [Helicocarpus griseus UAMH5409]|uniref:Postreplication repair E3 ubiquitin-protein ligase RAD18 n=1 Tax=Helicocarpus griseus UAMH5409 TaxID=1447875 RepID=A0A2B7X3G5_9EURO|nr:DNA repair protein rad18 [Helicocarpus griseus UAMH5409]
MDHAYDIPDSTDWLDTPLSELARVESALRCQVCKDFFDNPVITSCSHTFCSLCIRRCLSTEGKCPACRSPDQELKLRRNWAMQEMVDSFKQARPAVLDFARSATVRQDEPEEEDAELPAAKKRKIEPAMTGVAPEIGKETPGAEGRKTRPQSRRSEDQGQQMQVEVIEDTEDEDFEPDDGLVACPVCGRRMKNEAVFPHLDTCTGSPVPPKPSIPFGSLRSPARPSMQQAPAHIPQRLPTINYSLLKDTVLRRKLKELGIPDWGPKPLLQKRHTEWMNIWNANCDSKVPKSKRELLRELDIWERTQGGQASTASNLNPSNSVMRKDFDATAWSTTHGDDYKTLIANARRKREKVDHAAAPAAAPAEMPSVDDENARSHEPPKPQQVVSEQTEQTEQNGDQTLPESTHETPGAEGEEKKSTLDSDINRLNGESNNMDVEPDRQRAVEDAVA